MILSSTSDEKFVYRKKDFPIPIIVMRIVAGSALNFFFQKRMINREVKYVLVGL